MKAFVIPSIFTAIDRLSAPVKSMGSNVHAFASKAETAIARSERTFRKLTPSLSTAGKEFFSFASAAAIATGIIGGVSFSFNALEDYETAIASLSALTQKSGPALKPFITEVGAVAKSTKESSIEVAKAFELIGGANADLLESPKALSAVAKAAILMSQASGMPIAEAADSLTKSMNQFGVGAEQAISFIDILATSQGKGTATISQLAESMVVAGGTAKAFGLNFDQTNAYLQAFAKGGTLGSQAGTQLAGILSKLAKTSQKEFNPTIVGGDAALRNIINSGLGFSQIMKLTDAEGAKWLQTLINQKSVVENLSGSLNVSGAAAEAARIKNDTLAKATEQAKNAFINILTSSDNLSTGLTAVKRATQFVADNMDTIVSVGVGVLGFFAGWKTLLIAGRAALFAYNLFIGVQGALTGIASIAIGQSAVALFAYNAATWIAAAATAAWGAAMSIGLWPLTLIAIAIGVLIAIIYSVVQHIKGWGDQWEVITKFISLSTEAFVAGLKVHFGIIYHSFMTMVDGIVSAWKWGQNAIGNISDEQYARDKARIKQEQLARVAAIKENAKIASTKAVEAAKSLEWKLGWKTAEDVKAEEAAANAPLINTRATEQDVMTERMESFQQKNIGVDIRDHTRKAEVTSNNNLVIPNLGTTLGVAGYKF